MTIPPPFSFSHVGLYVFDIEAMARFYGEVFGMLETDRGVLAGGMPIRFLSRSAIDHHQIVLVGGRDAPPGAQLLNQISLRFESLADLRRLHAVLASRGDVSDLRPVNHGNAFSIYVRDPEMNRLELFTDSPFYVEQAVVEPLDLSLPDDAIVATTRARHQDHPSFRSIEAWRAEFARRLAEQDANGEEAVR